MMFPADEPEGYRVNAPDVPQTQASTAWQMPEQGMLCNTPADGRYSSSSKAALSLL